MITFYDNFMVFTVTWTTATPEDTCRCLPLCVLWSSINSLSLWFNSYSSPQSRRTKSFWVRGFLGNLQVLIWSGKKLGTSWKFSDTYRLIFQMIISWRLSRFNQLIVYPHHQVVDTLWSKVIWVGDIFIRKQF